MANINDIFNYEKAFSRNIGWITRCEQQALRGKCVAIAGMGGVGGIHLLTLVRLGIANFKIADMDKFDVANFNRQFGANLHSLNQPKVTTLANMAKDINPEVNIECFPEGITAENMDAFLQDVDLYIDGLDFFVLGIRADVFKRCYELKIPAITAAPLGMSTAYIIFMPDKMSFEDYFCLQGKSLDEQQLNFLLGLNPKGINFQYLVDPTSINLPEKRGPSTAMACLLCAGVTGTEALKILLNRGKIYAAPYYHLFDPYFSKYHRGWLVGGNKNPLQLIKKYLVKRMLKNTPPAIKEERTLTTIEKILDLARWAPSGDNNQPWRFKIIDDHKVIIYVKDHAENDLYDFNGFPTLVSCGCLLENIKLAATQFSMSCKWQYHSLGNHNHSFEIDLLPEDSLKADPLSYCISSRSVDRNRYQQKPLTDKQKKLLANTLPRSLQIIWFESFRDKFTIAHLNYLATEIRLKAKELYPIHKNVFDLENNFSETGLPLNSLGLNFLSRKMLAWSVKDWKRMQIMNRLGAAFFTGVEVDLLPGVACAAQFLVVTQAGLSPEFYIESGEGLQRFWLTATQLGLVMQPSFAPIMFRHYTKQQNQFLEDPKLIQKATVLTNKYDNLLQGNEVVFAGRIGTPLSIKPKKSRSTRKPLQALYFIDH